MAYGIETVRLLLPYGLPVVVAVGAVTFALVLLRRMRQLYEKVVLGEEELRAATSTWTNSLGALKKDIESIDVVKHPSTDADASVAIRRKVLKMHRLGSSVEQIARTLRLSKGEVTLLLKVHTIILHPVQHAGTAQNFQVIEQKS